MTAPTVGTKPAGTQKPLKVVVVPRSSPIDKLIAFKRVSLDLGDTYRLRVAFCGKNMPGPDDFNRFSAMCDQEGRPAYFIDVGAKKYHNIAPSASEVEAMSSETESGRIWNTLRELANKNNQTGCLKNARFSIAKMIRDVYEVMTGGDNSQELVFDHGMDVVNAFFYPQNKRQWEALFGDPLFDELRKLWEGFNVKEPEVLPFTLPLYFRHLFLSGRSAAEITEKISWWKDKANRVADRKDAATKKNYQVRQFALEGAQKPGHLVIKGFVGGLVHVESVFETEAFRYQYVGSGRLALGIVRSSLGHVHIQPSFKHSSLDLGPLFNELDEREPGCWYFEGRFSAGQMLMNGSRQYTGVTPTSLSDDELIRMVQRFVTFNR